MAEKDKFGNFCQYYLLIITVGKQTDRTGIYGRTDMIGSDQTGLDLTKNKRLSNQNDECKTELKMDRGSLTAVQNGPRFNRYRLKCGHMDRMPSLVIIGLSTSFEMKESFFKSNVFISNF